MGIVNIDDIFRIAMEIEKNGEEFYNKLSKKFIEKNQEVGNLYKSLASEENTHYDIFKKMLENMKNSNSITFNSLTKDYEEYMESYTNNVIFTNKAFKKELEKISTIAQAFDQSIKRELDSILYYQEIKALLPDNEADSINSIIIEERKHFLKLSKLKNEYK